MGYTTNRNIPYPEPNAYLAAGPQAIRDAVEQIDIWLGPRALFTAYKSASQVIPHAAWSGISNWQAVYDWGDDFDEAGGIYTCPASGIYLFNAGLCWATSNVGARYLSLWRAPDAASGATGYHEIPGVSQMAATGIDPRMSNSWVIHCAAGNLVQPRVFQTSGAGLTTVGAGDYSGDNAARFAAVLLAAD